MQADQCPQAVACLGASNCDSRWHNDHDPEGVIRGNGYADGARVEREAAMTPPAKAKEPSMEEFLAPIRRITADDDAGKPQKPEPAPKPVAAAPPPAKGPAPEPAAM